MGDSLCGLLMSLGLQAGVIKKRKPHHFDSCLHYLLILWPWASGLTSQNIFLYLYVEVILLICYGFPEYWVDVYKMYSRLILSSLPFSTVWSRLIKKWATVSLKDSTVGTSLVVQWVRLCAPNAGDRGSIPGQGTRSHMHAATKTWCSQNKK